MIQSGIFDGKIIHYKQGEGFFCVMFTKAGRVFDLVVSISCQVLDEILVCNNSGLLESIHTFDDLNIEKSLVVNNGKKAVLIDHFLGDERDVYLHILGVRK